MMQRHTQVTIAVALGAGLLGLLAAPAVAQPVDAAAPNAPAVAGKPAEDKPAAGKPAAAAGKTALPDGASIKVERTSSGAKLFRITEGLLVEGQMQRPNAFLVLQRATVDYDYEALSESFLPRIIAAAREKPF